MSIICLVCTYIFSLTSHLLYYYVCLQHRAPEHFDHTTIARNLSNNWALKSTNLRKLIRNLETYYHEELCKNTDFESHSSKIPKIAKSGDADGIEKLFELVAAAAVTCENKGIFVQRMMQMSENGQREMKGILESALGMLEDYDESDYEDSDESDDDEENRDHENDSDAENNSSAVYVSDQELDLDSPHVFDPTASSSSPNNKALVNNNNPMNDLSTIDYDDSNMFEVFGTHADFVQVVKERDELRKNVTDLKRELALTKSQSQLGLEENETTERKLRALVEDIQDRLSTREEELSQTELELKRTKRDLEDAFAKVSHANEQNALLADELDVANAKAGQLRKAEATVAAYRKKLVGAGQMSQQMADLEDQAADYLRQIMNLENEVKAVPGLQKKVQELNDTLTKLSNEKVDLEVDVKGKSSEISRLSSDLTHALKDKEMYEEELETMRLTQKINEDDLALPNNLSLTSTKSVSEHREKLMRLEIENKRQKEHIAKLKEEASKVPKYTSSSGGASSTEIRQLKATINRLTADKDKLGSDKEKLEAYTKKTLAKFQEKYLVALQECKAKLKEKHDKIEALELRNAAEKNAQKREERLLSSTIYELGLAIMQNRLKDKP